VTVALAELRSLEDPFGGADEGLLAFAELLFALLPHQLAEVLRLDAHVGEVARDEHAQPREEGAHLGRPDAVERPLRREGRVNPAQLVGRESRGTGRLRTCGPRGRCTRVVRWRPLRSPAATGMHGTVRLPRLDIMPVKELPEIAADERGLGVAADAIQDPSADDHVQVVPIVASPHEDEPRVAHELDLADDTPDTDPMEVEPPPPDPPADRIAAMFPQATVGGALQLVDRAVAQVQGREVVAGEDQGAAVIGANHEPK